MMGGRRKQVGLACDEGIRRRYVDADDLARLETVADFSFRPFSVASGRDGPAPRDSEAESGLAEFASGLDVLVVGDGAPFVSAAVIAAAPQPDAARRARRRPFRLPARPRGGAQPRRAGRRHLACFVLADRGVGARPGARRAAQRGRVLQADDHARADVVPVRRALRPRVRRRGADRQARRHDRVRASRATPRRAAPPVPGRDRRLRPVRAPRSWPSPTASRSGRSRQSWRPTSCSSWCRRRRRPRGCFRAPSSSCCVRERCS